MAAILLWDSSLSFEFTGSCALTSDGSCTGGGGSTGRAGTGADRLGRVRSGSGMIGGGKGGSESRGMRGKIGGGNADTDVSKLVENRGIFRMVESDSPILLLFISDALLFLALDIAEFTRSEIALVARFDSPT